MKMYGDIEYRMTSTMAKEILNSRKGEDKKMNPQEALIKYVNEELRVKGNCVVVTTTL